MTPAVITTMIEEEWKSRSLTSTVNIPGAHTSGEERPDGPVGWFAKRREAMRRASKPIRK
jgi:hypothetical protein